MNSCGYKNILENFELAGYIFSTDWNKVVNGKKILLRHDIDFSIEAAERMANAEAELGIFATYFFMATSNMYNLLSKNSSESVKRIKKMGHKISLHFDPTAHNNNELFLLEKNLFEKMFETSVDIVSIHRPGDFLKNNNQLLCSCPHTYQNKYFNDMKYISDSGGKDITDTLQVYIDENKDKALHLLIHPIWWDSDCSSPVEVLDSWLERKKIFLSEEVSLNCRSYRGDK